MKENTTFWERELVLPWRSKLNFTRGGGRRLPKTLSSIQIILLCGFASILLLRNAITNGSFSWFDQVTTEIETSPHSLASFSAPKRTIAQIKESSVEKEIAAIKKENVNDGYEKQIKIEAEAKEVKNPELPEKKSETEQNQNEILQQQRKLEAEVKIEDDEKKNPELLEKNSETEQKQNEIPQQQRKLEAEMKIKDEEKNPELLEKNAETEQKQNQIPQQQRKLEAEVKIKDEEEKNPELLERNPETEQKQNEIPQQQRKLEAEVKIKDEEEKNPELLEKNSETEQKQNELSQQQRKLETELKIKDDEPKEVKNPELLEKKSETEQNEIPEQQGKFETEVKKEDMYMPTWMPPGMEVKSLGPTPKNWDEQRAAWLEKYPEKRLNTDGKQRMLLITGSSPSPCSNPVGDHYYLKYVKNKMDYCRQHNMEIFYNFAHLDKDFDIFWAKLPIVRTLMLNHPEIEWFFWMDADAAFTDMLFEIPVDKYKDYNFVMWGYDSGFYGEKSWVAINAGVFFIRNCQWSLDLIDMWAPMGPLGPARDEAGKLLTAYMTRRDDVPADDQSALGYLILSKPELQAKVKLEEDYMLSGYWVDHVEHYEEHMTKDHPGLGDKRWPFITHFTGCSVCSGESNPAYDELNCRKHMERAFNFADNQVLQVLGFQHESLETASVKRIKEENDHPLDDLGPNTWATPSESYGL